MYAVFGEGEDARIIGFYNEAVYERFLADPVLYESTANMTWNEQRDEALVLWNAVADKIRSLNEEQATVTN